MTEDLSPSAKDETHEDGNAGEAEYNDRRFLAFAFCRHDAC